MRIRHYANRITSLNPTPPVCIPLIDGRLLAHILDTLMGAGKLAIAAQNLVMDTLKGPYDVA